MVEIPEYSREELQKMTPEERIKALRAIQAAKQKQLEEAQKKASKDISEASKLIEKTEEEAEEEERREIEQERHIEEEQKETQDSLEEMLAGVAPSEEDDPYKTGSEYQTNPGGAYDSNDPRIGEGVDRLGPGISPELREQYARDNKGRERDDKKDQYLLPHQRGAQDFLDDAYNR